MIVILRGLEALLELQLWPLRLQIPTKVIIQVSWNSWRGGEGNLSGRWAHSPINIIALEDQAQKVGFVCPWLNAPTTYAWGLAGVNLLLKQNKQKIPANIRVKGETNYPCTKKSQVLTGKDKAQRMISLIKRDYIFLKNPCSFCWKVECVFPKGPKICFCCYIAVNIGNSYGMELVLASWSLKAIFFSS